MEPGSRTKVSFSHFTSEVYRWRKENLWLFVQKN